VHTCPDCGKTMATVGGLEIHVEMNHAAPAAQPTAAPAPAAVDPTSVPMPVPTPAARASAPILRGYDPTIPLTAVLVVVMLVAGIGAAMHRSSNPPHHLVAATTSDASASEGGFTDTSVTTIAPLPAQAPAPPAPSSAGSPAAIPPADSQSPAAAQTSSPCERVIASLSTRPSKRNVDIASLMRANTFPALPLGGFEHPSVLALTRYDTVQEYLDDSYDPSDPRTAVWAREMTAAGFIGAEAIEFSNAGSRYGAVVFRFATATGAREFNRATLGESCSLGIVENGQPMAGLSGGMNYLLTEDGSPPYRATFVAGDTVVRLHICHCVQAPDDQVLAGQWAQAVASAVGAA
jgi:hypothetical protein